MCTVFLFSRRISCADPSFDQEDVEDPEYTAPDSDCFDGNEGVMSLPTI
jgi:hypothetical protein